MCVRASRCTEALRTCCPLTPSTHPALGLAGALAALPLPQVVLPGNLELPRFRHLLIAFGGPEGLEDCLAHDKRFTKQTTTDVFDLYLNTCPGQGSRTIRTEEAILISMAFFQTAIGRFGER
jgi:hypothetical protein